MRIAIISPWAISSTAVGGTERYVIDLAEGLTIRGHGVTVFMLSGNSHKTGGVVYKSLDLLGDGTTATEYDLRRVLGDFADTTSFDELAKFIESKVNKFNFDVFHINSLLFLKIWPGENRMFTIHTNPYEYQLDWGIAGYRKMVQLMKDEAIRSRTKLTAPSRHYAKLLSDELGVTVVHIPHAIDTARISTTSNWEALRIKYNLHPTKTTLLLPSRLEPTQKRPQIAFEALARLPANLRTSLQIVATGLDTQYVSFQEELRRISETAGFTAHFLRFDNMADAYAIADIVGLPSKSESFGYAALESLSLGKLTILNDIPPYREIGASSPHAYFFTDTAVVFADVLEKALGSVSKDNLVAEEWLAPYQIDRWISSYTTVMLG